MDCTGKKYNPPNVRRLLLLNLNLILKSNVNCCQCAQRFYTPLFLTRLVIFYL